MSPALNRDQCVELEVETPVRRATAKAIAAGAIPLGREKARAIRRAQKPWYRERRAAATQENHNV